MAAHLKTGLEQCLQAIEEGKFDKAWIEPAINLSCWTEDNVDVWTDLYKFTKDDLDIYVIKVLLEAHLCNANIEWQNLGQPATREDWHKAKYG